MALGSRLKVSLTYRLIPSLMEHRLAKVQFWVFAFFSPFLMLGVYLTLANINYALVAIASLGVSIGGLLFAIIMWQNWLRGN